MTLTPDLAELRRLAEAATKGRWTTGPTTCAGDVWVYIDGSPLLEPTHWLWKAFRLRKVPERLWEPNESGNLASDPFWRQKEANAQFIAAANPMTLLTLLNRIAELEERWRAHQLDAPEAD